MVLDAISLNILWDFLKPILSGAITERIKPKDSAKTAKIKVIYLYQTLGDVSLKTDDVVTNFQSYVELVETNAPKEEILEKRNSLEYAAYRLICVLPELANALDAVNPQLEIHKQDLVQDICKYYYNMYRLDPLFMTTPKEIDIIKEIKKLTKPDNLTELEKNVLRIDGESKITLKPLVAQAQENRNLINKAIEDLRIFIAKEFSFKESF